jgi:hypothetical protein
MREARSPAAMRVPGSGKVRMPRNPLRHPIGLPPIAGLQGPVGQPTEYGRTVVGAIMIAESANNRIGLLNLFADRDGVVAESPASLRPLVSTMLRGKVRSQVRQ